MNIKTNKMSDFKYEFNFTNGVFEQVIYDKCDIKDNIGGRQIIIENMVLEILTIFKNIPGLHIFSTFVNYDNINYKITLKNQ